MVSTQSVDELKKATVAISRFLLEFFVEVGEGGEARVMRPLTNSNFVLDFYRFRDAPYFATMTRYVYQSRPFVANSTGHRTCSTESTESNCSLCFTLVG